MFGLSKKEKLPKEIRRVLKPSPDFVRKTKNVFLTKWHNRFGAAPRPAPRFSFAYKTIIAILVVLGLTGGASVYADTKNVGADNVLYPLKRHNESLRLVLANENDQPRLRLEFANRRLTETNNIKNLATSTVPQKSRLIQNLNKEVEGYLEEFGEKDFPKNGRLPKFCNSLVNFFDAASPISEKVLSKHQKVIERFSENCSKFLENHSEEQKVENDD